MFALKSGRRWLESGRLDFIASTTVGTQPNEMQIISNISGNKVTLDRALAMATFRYPPNSKLRCQHHPQRRHYLENNAIDRHGHVMFMHNNDVYIAYADSISLDAPINRSPLTIRS